MVLGHILACHIYLSGYTLNSAEIMISLLVPVADWSVQTLGIKASTNIRRLITGTIGGIGIMAVIFNLAAALIQLL